MAPEPRMPPTRDPADDLRRLLHEAVRGVTDLVEASHEQVSSHVVRAARAVGVGDQAEAIDGVRRLLTAGSLIGVRGVNAAVEALGDAGFLALRRLLGLGVPADGPPPLAPLRSDALANAPGFADAALGVLNGAFGDGLAARGHSLDLGLGLRLAVEGPAGQRLLPTDDDALAAALAAALRDDQEVRGVAVLVHGLAVTEWGFCFGAEEQWGDPAQHYGALLRREHGLLPLLVRYNSGRAIAHSGAALHERLGALERALPPALAQAGRMTLVGHSMGGLVLREAAARAHDEAAPWLDRVDAAICLGSPHHGAPLERVAAGLTQALGRIPLPGAAIPAALLALRSAGIRDLAHGDGARHVAGAPRDAADDDEAPLEADDEADALASEDGLEGAGAAAEPPWRQERWPEPPQLRWLLVAGTVAAASPADVAAPGVGHRVLGDGMVSVRSALAAGWPDVALERATVHGVSHPQLANHPRVWAEISGFLRRAPEPAVAPPPAPTRGKGRRKR